MELSASKQGPANTQQSDDGGNLTEEAPTHTTRHGCVINLPSQYTKNTAFLFRTMINGLVNCNKLQEEKDQCIITLLTLAKQGSIESLPPTIGECI